jgi:hypothetical protein
MPRPSVSHSAGVILPVSSLGWSYFLVHGNRFDTTDHVAQDTTASTPSTYQYDFDYQIVDDPHGHANKTLMIVKIKRAALVQALATAPVSGDIDEVTYNVFDTTGPGADATVTVVYSDDPPSSARKVVAAKSAKAAGKSAKPARAAAKR